MATNYRTKEGDTLDWICWKFYGNRPGAVELVLDANPTLADQPPELPANLQICLPELPVDNQDGGVKLWD